MDTVLACPSIQNVARALLHETPFRMLLSRAAARDVSRHPGPFVSCCFVRLASLVPKCPHAVRPSLATPTHGCTERRCLQHAEPCAPHACAERPPDGFAERVGAVARSPPLSAYRTSQLVVRRIGRLHELDRPLLAHAHFRLAQRERSGLGVVQNLHICRHHLTVGSTHDHGPWCRRLPP